MRYYFCQQLSESTFQPMKSFNHLLPQYLFPLLLAGVLASPALADSNPPERLTYQGFVVDADGAALGLAAPKNYDIVFRIWSDQAATDADDLLWSEQQTVTIDKGYFSVLLGEGVAFGGERRPALSSVFFAPDASERYVELMVKRIGPGNTDVTISPRLRLLASPYAFLARNATYATSLVNDTNKQVVTIQSGFVGINKTAPSSALDVQGTVTATTFAGNGTIPVGGIIMWSGSVATVPQGWAICDGKNGTPNLSGRFVLGAGSEPGLTPRSPGQTGGEEAHQLSIAEMPAHGHSISVNTVGYSASWNGSAEATAAPGQGRNNGWRTWNTAGAGSSAAHNNMPPYYVLAYIMRVL